MKIKFEYFVPEKIKKNYKKEKLNYSDKNEYFTFSGKASLYYILKEYNIKKIMLPAYICNSVLKPIDELFIEKIFYDINIYDLNPSYESIIKVYNKYKADCVLVPSLYGFSSDLDEIEKYCKKNGIILVDDAAQSAGVKVNGKYIGNFGNAGFISFSPGKNTVSAYGCVMFTENKINISYEKNIIYKLIKKLQFSYCRLNIYKKFSLKIIRKKINKLAKKAVKKNQYNLYIAETDKKQLLNNLNYTINYLNPERKKYFNEFYNIFKSNSIFKIIFNNKCEYYPSKIVLLFKGKEEAFYFMEILKKKNIKTRNGYKLITSDLTDLPNTDRINQCVVELPIECNKIKMNYLNETVKDYLKW